MFDTLYCDGAVDIDACSPFDWKRLPHKGQKRQNQQPSCLLFNKIEMVVSDGSLPHRSPYCCCCCSNPHLSNIHVCYNATASVVFARSESKQARKDRPLAVPHFCSSFWRWKKRLRYGALHKTAQQLAVILYSGTAHNVHMIPACQP